MSRQDAEEPLELAETPLSLLDYSYVVRRRPDSFQKRIDKGEEMARRPLQQAADA